MAKAVITDSMSGDVAIERGLIEKLGCEVELRQCRSASELIDLCADADYVLTQFARIDASVIGAMRKAKVIVRYGIGVDNIDLAAAAAKGIPVCNVPDYCIDEVADHTLAMILDLTRGISRTSACVKSGQWRLPMPVASMRTLRSLTVGVIGFGRIGRAVARRLVGFEAKVLVVDPVARVADIVATGCTPAPLEALLSSSDVITLHCPSTAATKRMINAQSLQLCKRGALLVNVGRGDLVDTDVLVEALRSGQIEAAALDVLEKEPIAADHPLLGMPQVVLTPHAASGSARAGRALVEGVAKAVERAVLGIKPINVVNGVGDYPAAVAQTSAQR